MIQLYGQFLLSSQVTYTGTYLAEQLAGLQHDDMQCFLKPRALSPPALAAGAGRVRAQRPRLRALR